MPEVKTFVFFDTETTGLPSHENNRTKITEISFIAVKRDHIIDTRPGLTPRVQQKITLCFNPGRPILPASTETTGLCNDLLEFEPYFNEKSFHIIDSFISQLSKPICIVAHNGDRFDYPILKSAINRVCDKSLQSDLLCVDSWKAFRAILGQNVNTNKIICSSSSGESLSSSGKLQFEKIHDKIDRSDLKLHNPPEDILQGIKTTNKKVIIDETRTGQMPAALISSPNTNVLHDYLKMGNQSNQSTPAVTEEPTKSPKNLMYMKSLNETTPKAQIIEHPIENLRKKYGNFRNAALNPRRLFVEKNGKSKDSSYKLKDVYERLLKKPALNCHRAESDCILLLECAVVLKDEFISWVDDNCRYFSDIKSMEIGVPL